MNAETSKNKSCLRKNIKILCSIINFSLYLQKYFVCLKKVKQKNYIVRLRSFVLMAYQPLIVI